MRSVVCCHCFGKKVPLSAWLFPRLFQWRWCCCRSKIVCISAFCTCRTNTDHSFHHHHYCSVSSLFRSRSAFWILHTTSTYTFMRSVHYSLMACVCVLVLLIWDCKVEQIYKFFAVFFFFVFSACSSLSSAGFRVCSVCARAHCQRIFIAFLYSFSLLPDTLFFFPFPIVFRFVFKFFIVLPQMAIQFSLNLLLAFFLVAPPDGCHFIRTRLRRNRDYFFF